MSTTYRSQGWGWWKHRSDWILTYTYTVLAVTYPLCKVLGAPDVIAVFLIPVLIAGFIGRSLHTIGALCERCLVDLPDHPDQEAQDRLPALAWAHRMYDWRMLGPQVVLFLLLYFVPEPIYTIILTTLFVWYAVDFRALAIHHRLRPQCPWCKPGEGWNEGAPEPAPDPAMTKDG
jgi:hypothetical protein